MKLDLREQYSPGYKFNDWEMRGVPLRIEMGPRDIESGNCILVRRDTLEKITVSMENLENEIDNLLEKIQKNMFEICKKRMEENTRVARNFEEFVKIGNEQGGLIKAMWCGNKECEEKIKEVTTIKSRCIPFEQENISDVCVCCGKKADKMVIWGKQY